jgi:hypothetical protein
VILLWLPSCWPLHGMLLLLLVPVAAAAALQGTACCYLLVHTLASSVHHYVTPARGNETCSVSLHVAWISSAKCTYAAAPACRCKLVHQMRPYLLSTTGAGQRHSLRKPSVVRHGCCCCRRAGEDTVVLLLLLVLLHGGGPKDMRAFVDKLIIAHIISRF